MIVFFSCSSGSQFKACRELRYPHVLINFATQKNKPPSYNPVIFIDSGGFYSSLKTGEYKSTDEEYLEYVDKIRPFAWALRDYPCEPELLKKWGRTPRENILRTVDNHRKLLGIADDLGISDTAVSVVQGWSLDDYLYCLDEFRSAGLIRNYMAIGSICRRGQLNTISKIITTLRQELPGWVKLHGFGLKITALENKAVWDSLYSIDTGAWDYNARWSKIRFKINPSDASLLAAKQYIEKIKTIEFKMTYKKR